MTQNALAVRLHEECQHEGKNVHFMSPTVRMCSTMFRVDPQHLLWTLENLVEGKVVNRVQVPQAEAEQARLALQRMLDVSP